MAVNYNEYLATTIQIDGKIVTYRLLSRVLKVNVNIAKHILYDFYSNQNAKKPKSIHATYLLAGKQTPPAPDRSNGTHTGDGEDVVMQSSPFTSSKVERKDSPEMTEEPNPVMTVILVREEELDQKKSELKEITSIHVYSLEPGAVENMNLLSVANQGAVKFSNDVDPLERWRTYGCIHNAHIKKRTKFVPPPATEPSSTSAVKPAPKAVVKPSMGGASDEMEAATTSSSRRGSLSEESKSGHSTPRPSSSSGTVKKTDLKSNLRQRNDISKLFAKAPKPKEKLKESPTPQEDETMQGMSSDEDAEDEASQVDEAKAVAVRKAAEKARKKREENEAKLKAMMEDMDDDDEDMPDAPTEPEPDSQDAPIDKASDSQPTETEAAVTVQGGRRRGRRRVRQKKQFKDEDGYMVTSEQWGWESFSEAEPELKKAKPAPKASTAKGKKTGTGKYGQGSIASFFTKK